MTFKDIGSGLRTLLHKRRAEDELDAEVRGYLEALAQRKVESGLSPSEAMRASRLEMGSVDAVKEAVRDVGWEQVVESIWQDVRYALRRALRDPAATLACIGSLALGIACTTASFSVIVGVLWHPYPYKGADRMVSFSVVDSGGNGVSLQLPIAQFRTFRAASVLDDAAAWDLWTMSTTDNNGLPESVRVGYITPNALRFYGVRMFMGAPFTKESLDYSGQPARQVILTWDYWQSHFGGSPAVLGKSLEFDGQPYTVTGILPRNFAPLAGLVTTEPDVDVYVLLALSNDLNSVYMITGRLKPGVTTDAASSALLPLLRQFAAETPNHFPRNFGLRVETLESALVNRFSATFTAVFAASVLLLAIACLNVSVLLLARGTARAHEFAVRISLGATLNRLFGQLLTESVFLSVAGGCVGVLASFGIIHLVLHWMPTGELPQEARIRISVPILLFATIVAVGCGILFGIAPAQRFSRGRERLNTQFDTRSAVGNQSTRRLHSLLMVAQVAITLFLATGAAVAASTVLRLHAAPLGFDPRNVTSLGMWLSEGTFTTWSARTQYYSSIRAQVAALPSVSSAALSALPLPPVSRDIVPVRVQGSVDSGRSATLQIVSHDFFRTLKIPLLQGRIWTESEEANGATLAVINQRMAREFWGDGDPIGRTLSSDGLQSKNGWILQAPSSNSSVKIIGVIGDTPNDGLLQPALPALYIPYTLLTFDGIQILVRTAGASEAIVRSVRRQVARVNSAQPLSPIFTAEDHLKAEGWVREQFLAVLFLIFAVAAGLLAALGIYSVVSYSVSQRLKEFGVRMALGASPSNILWISARSVARNLGIGLLAGALLSVALSRVIAQWTQANYVSVAPLISAASVLVLVGALATLVPALRARNMNPMDVLRSDQ